MKRIFILVVIMMTIYSCLLHVNSVIAGDKTKYKFIVLMDCSSSMKNADSNNGEISIPFTALRMFADAVSLFESSELALVYFSNEASTDGFISIENTEELGNLKSKMNKSRYEVTDGSNIKAALSEAEDLIEEDGDKSNVKYIIVLISDGLVSVEGNNTESAQESGRLIDNFNERNNVSFKYLRWDEPKVTGTAPLLTKPDYTFKKLESVYVSILELLSDIFEKNEGFGAEEYNGEFWEVEPIGADCQLIVLIYYEEKIDEKLTVMFGFTQPFEGTRDNITAELPYDYFKIESNDFEGVWRIEGGSPKEIRIFTRYKPYIYYEHDDKNNNDKFKTKREYGKPFEFDVELRLKGEKIDDATFIGGDLICDNKNITIEKDEKNEKWIIKADEDFTGSINLNLKFKDETTNTECSEKITIPAVASLELTSLAKIMQSASSINLKNEKTIENYRFGNKIIFSPKDLFIDSDTKKIKFSEIVGSGEIVDDKIEIPIDGIGMSKYVIRAKAENGQKIELAFSAIYSQDEVATNKKKPWWLFIIVVFVVVVIVALIIVKKRKKQ